MQNKLRGKNVERVPESGFPHFETLLDELIEFCKIMKKQNKTNQNLMKNSVNVRLVSIVENSLRASIAKVIDKNNLDPRTILDVDSITIDLDILNHIKSDEYSKGTIVIAHLDKMNSKIIDETMSRINKLDFFRWYESVKGTTTIGEFYPYLHNLYQTRNDIVHNLIDSEDSEKDLIKKINALKQFIFDLYFFTPLNIGLFEKNMGDVKAEKLAARLFPDESPSKSLARFKKITKQFREDYSTNTRRY